MATKSRMSTRKAAAPSRRAAVRTHRKALPERVAITRARQELCPLVKELSERDDGVVGIMVGEEVGAYLVSPERMEQLEEASRRMRLAERPTLQGGIEVIGDLDEALDDARRALQDELDRRIERTLAAVAGKDQP